MIKMNVQRYDVLITSAGVASAVNVISSLRSAPDVQLRIVAGDMDPLAPGLFLADSSYVLPPISESGYIEKLNIIAQKEKLDYLIPIFSREIELVSSRIDTLRDNGLKCMVPGTSSLSIVNDKKKFSKWLISKGIPGPVPIDPNEGPYPLFVKPRRGSSSKGARLVPSMGELGDVDITSNVFQEYIEGKEYTIDFLASENHELMAAVPRERIEVKDGKAVKTRTVTLPEGVDILRKIVKDLQYKGPGNLQVIKGKKGLMVIELNPRFAAGGLPLATASGPNMPLMLLEMLSKGTIDPVMEYRSNLIMVRYLSNIFIEERNGSLKRI
ncbi:MAG: ATP-grasp domain-containing protein [Thermoplasmata archaeon]|nr:ATP-grasp domain-containing protein [Thermoplasmata archaeon]